MQKIRRHKDLCKALFIHGSSKYFGW
jgi:hypothetical protein